MYSAEEKTMRQLENELTAVHEQLETERARRMAAEQALGESDSRFEALANSTAAGILIHKGGRFLYANAAAAVITGYSVEEILEKKFWALVHPDYQELVRRRDTDGLKGKRTPTQYELILISKSGEERWVHITKGVIEFDGNRAIISTLFDISERKEAQASLAEANDFISQANEELEKRVEERTAALAASEARLSAFLQSSPDPIVIYDDEDRVTYVNPMFTHTFGWTLDEIMGKPLNFLPEGYSNETSKTWDRLHEEDYIFNFETRRLTKGGTILDVEISIGRFETREGERMGMVVTLRDVTQRKRAEKQLRKYREQLEELVRERTQKLEARVAEISILNEIIQTVTLVTDLKTVLQIVTEALSRLFDAKHASVALFEENQDVLVITADHTNFVNEAERRAKESVLGSHIVVSEQPPTLKVLETKRPIVICDAQRNPDTAVMHQTLRKRGTHCLMIVPLITRGEVIGTVGIDLDDPERAFIEEEVRLAETIAGQVAGAIGNARLYSAAQQEILERKQAQVDLAQARDEAVEASQLKSQLLAKVSHELRTPLNAILGYAELLQNNTFGLLEPQQNRVTGEIISHANYLTETVNELLDQAQIDRQKVVMRREPYDLRQLVRQVTSQMSVLAASKSLAFKFEVEKDVPLLLVGDQQRIQQILLNLTGNAIKFTEEGEIEIKISRPNEDYWRLCVRDTGPGIAPEMQKQVFEPFWQADGTVTRKHQGTGLGLSIVKQLVTLMNGEIQLDSEVGKGSIFTVNLPIIEQERAK